MEKEDIISVQRAQEDVETSYNLLNNNNNTASITGKKERQTKPTQNSVYWSLKTFVPSAVISWECVHTYK